PLFLLSKKAGKILQKTASYLQSFFVSPLMDHSIPYIPHANFPCKSLLFAQIFDLPDMPESQDVAFEVPTPKLLLKAAPSIAFSFHWLVSSGLFYTLSPTNTYLSYAPPTQSVCSHNHPALNIIYHK